MHQTTDKCKGLVHPATVKMKDWTCKTTSKTGRSDAHTAHHSLILTLEFLRKLRMGQKYGVLMRLVFCKLVSAHDQSHQHTTLLTRAHLRIVNKFGNILLTKTNLSHT